MMDFDGVMEVVGSRGAYQRWVIGAVIFPTSLFCGLTVNFVLFQVAAPEHWCHVPGRLNTSMSEQEWRHLTIPPDPVETWKLSSCLQYNIEWVEQDTYIVHNDTIACQRGWDFDKSEFHETLVTANEWYCERSGYPDNIFAVISSGSSVGTVVLPAIADRFIGRRLMFFVSLLIHVVFTLPCAWVGTYGAQLALRFFAATAFETYYLMPYVIALEFLAPEQRTVAALVSFAAWTVGMCSVSLISWLIPHWQYLVFLSCIPASFGVVYWRALPESPRWLLAKGRTRDCASILLKVAEYNGKKSVSRVQIEKDLDVLWSMQEKEMSLKEIIQYPNLRVRAVIIFILCACTFLVYGLVFFGITSLASNAFLSHFIISLFELPSNALGWAMTHYTGRRFTGVMSFLATAALCLIAPFCLQDHWAMLALYAFIRLFATQLIYVVFVQCTEIFPTPVRSTGFAWMVVCGLMAMIAAPYVLNSGLGPAFPYWLGLALMLICAVLCVLLPETIGLPLPQTFQDSEELGVDRPLTRWVHHWNKHKYSPVPQDPTPELKPPLHSE